MSASEETVTDFVKKGWDLQLGLPVKNVNVEKI
jgi:hypothetical protein